MAKRKIKDLKVTRPRDIAVNALNAFLFGKTLLQDYLDREFRSVDLESNDKRFITELVNGTCRHLMTIDHIILKYSNRPLKQIDPLVLQILRIGVYQLIYMRTPDFASLNESVGQARETGYTGAAGFVNAILRNIQRGIDMTCNIAAGQYKPRFDVMIDGKTVCRFKKMLFPDKKSSPDKFFSIAFSYPKWLVERWIKAFGVDKTFELCVAANSKPGIWIRPNTLRADGEKIKAQLIEQGLNFNIADLEVENAGKAQAFELLSRTNPVNITGFENGEFYIQDWMAQHPVIALNPQPGEKILDLCAAPGGKTTHIAAMMNNQGYVLAVDTVRKKIDKIEENCQRLGVSIAETCKVDAFDEKISELDTQFDAAIVDVPCSNTGVLARRVEARHILKPTDVNGNTTLQRELLEKAFSLVKSGGRIVYSTCSIEAAENQLLVKSFLEGRSDCELLCECTILPEVKYLKPPKTLGNASEPDAKSPSKPERELVSYIQSCHDGGYYALIIKK